MKTVKGILLWITAISIAVSLSSIDFLINKGITTLLEVLILNILLVRACSHITVREIVTLSGYKWLYKNILYERKTKNVHGGCC